MAFVQKVFYLAALLGISQLFCKVESQQYSKQSKEASQFGMKLQGHIFKRMAGPSYVCVKECRLDLRCQSFNYVIITSKNTMTLLKMLFIKVKSR